ncbi:unnamed protein product [Meloidogyne enterolobii]|uniref:Uncharacterized protein n=1 Tax=Meloidogyne enterolobii TaxID=390850 RepID=A0ACB0Y6Z9_MELEN
MFGYFLFDVCNLGFLYIVPILVYFPPSNFLRPINVEFIFFSSFLFFLFFLIFYNCSLCHSFKFA